MRKAFGEEAQKICEHLELSQKTMAEALGFPTVHPTNISGYETGKREPDPVSRMKRKATTRLTCRQPEGGKSL